MKTQIRVNGDRAQLRVIEGEVVLNIVNNAGKTPIEGLRFEDNCAIFENRRTRIDNPSKLWVTVERR